MPTTRATQARRAAQRAGSLLGNALLVAAMLVALAYLVPGLLGFERYVITGGSMSGTFEKGSIAVERAVPVGDLEVGDVITYLPPADSGVTNLVTHRITEIDTTTGVPVLRTQGDANDAVDPWAFSLASSHQPRVVMTIPLVGYVFIALADPSTRILVIGVPAALVALGSAVELVRALRPARDGLADPAAVTVPAAVVADGPAAGRA